LLGKILPDACDRSGHSLAFLLYIDPKKKYSMATKNETISVAVATRNRAHMLNETLESLEKQRIIPHEIVVFDNASSDETRKVVERMQGRLPIKYQYCRKIGINPTRNHALKKCAGDIIFFLDDDLYCHPHLIAVILDFFRRKPYVAAVQGFLGNYQPDRLVPSVSQFTESTVAAVRCRNNETVILPTMITTSVFAIRKCIVDDHQLSFDESLERGGDREFAHKIITQGLEIGYEKNAIVLHKNWSSTAWKYLQRRIRYGKARASIVRKYGATWIEEQNKRMGWREIINLAGKETICFGVIKKAAFFTLVGLGHILTRISFLYHLLKADLSM